MAGPHVASRSGEHVVWHHTGDVGGFDDRGRLWLMGRREDLVPHRGRWLHPLPVEQEVLDTFSEVARVALVATPRRPNGVLVVKVDPRSDEEAVLGRVGSWLENRGLGEVALAAVRRMPVDRRHNSKIDRTTLRRKF